MPNFTPPGFNNGQGAAGFGNFLVPNADTAAYGMLHSFNMIGGFTEVMTLADRNAIPIYDNGTGTHTGITAGVDGMSNGRRRIGMLVYVAEDQKIYQLVPKGYLGNGGNGTLDDFQALEEWDQAVLLDPTATNVFDDNFIPPGQGGPAFGQVSGSGNADDCWVEVGLEGPAGADGADGADGAPGPQGPAGPAGADAPVKVFEFHAPVSTHYKVGGDGEYEDPANNINPTLYVCKGETYTFKRVDPNHPLRIRNQNGDIQAGVAQGFNFPIEEGNDLVWKVPQDAFGTYTYACDVHPGMTGQIVVCCADGTPAPDPTATPVPDPTATPVPDPTATEVPEPTATPRPEPTATPEPTEVFEFFINVEQTRGTAGPDECGDTSLTVYANQSEYNSVQGAQVGHYVYVDAQLAQPYNGADLWYTVSNLQGAGEFQWQINSSGVIIKIEPCEIIDPTATPVPDPTATPVPDPTATPVPEPTATEVPEPTATPEPTETFEFFINVEQTRGTASSSNECGDTSLTVYANQSEYNSVQNAQVGHYVYVDAQLAQPYNGDGLWYTVSNFQGAGELQWQINSAGEITKIQPCQIIDPTATPVPDPTATPVPEPTATEVPEPTATPVAATQYFVHANSGEGNNATTDPCQPVSIPIWSPDSALTVGSTLWTDAGLTNSFDGAAQMYTIDTVNGATPGVQYSVRQGAITSIFDCAQVTPTPTSPEVTPTATPVMTSASKFFHLGAGSYPYNQDLLSGPQFLSDNSESTSNPVFEAVFADMLANSEAYEPVGDITLGEGATWTYATSVASNYYWLAVPTSAAIPDLTQNALIADVDSQIPQTAAKKLVFNYGGQGWTLYQLATQPTTGPLGFMWVG